MACDHGNVDPCNDTALDRCGFDAKTLRPRPFDEPLSNLDAKLRVQIRLEIRELQAKLGIMSLYVTHD